MKLFIELTIILWYYEYGGVGRLEKYMSDENKRNLDEQLIKCLLDDKIPSDIKLKKMNYIVCLGADVDAEMDCSQNSYPQYSVLGLAKAIRDDKIISFLEEKGAKNDISPTYDKLEYFFSLESVDRINDFLKMLPNGFVLDCNISFGYKNFSKLPDFSKVIVSGAFDCRTLGLHTLEGSPKEVWGNFECMGNNLKTLKGAPSIVKGNFDCTGNEIISLEGAPLIVGGYFRCTCNKLKTLENGPIEVAGSYICGNNELVSLAGMPKMIKGDFDCHNNKITSLEGGPIEVVGNVDCSGNEIRSLIGAPVKIGGDFDYDVDSFEFCTIRKKLLSNSGK